MDPLSTTLLGILAIVCALALLILAPSRAGMWRWLEFYAQIHAEANEHMDKRKATRRAMAERTGEVGR